MKKVSAKVFFTVLWRGMCQALGWFFGLFGYKREGGFAKCVWGVFAFSSAIVMAVIALTIVCALSEVIKERYFKSCHSSVEDCYNSECVDRNIYFHNTYDGKGYIYNALNDEITLENVDWIAKPLGNDTLVCFSNGEKRGYFSKNTGKVIIEPKYRHAWVFSEGLASIEEDGYIKFIDGTGKIVLDVHTPYFSGMDDYVFHGGYCVVYGDGLDTYGMIDKTGKDVLPREYTAIRRTWDYDMWVIVKDKESGLLDKDLNIVLPLAKCSIGVSDGMVSMTMPDHTMRLYDLQGNLINDFYVSSIRKLEYEKDEILIRHIVEENEGVDGPCKTITDEEYHPNATARLRAYVAGDDYEGLMTADGHKVTLPIYQNISAIGYDLYLCHVNGESHVIINGKGEVVK